MTYATNPNDGVRIHYEIEGAGPSLVMLHGLAGNSDQWRELGYVDALQDRFRLLLVDSRGHAKSDKPVSGDAYARRRQALDILAVLDAEQVETTHFWGYSFGSWTGYQVGVSYPDRITSMILGAQHPYSIPEEKAWLQENGPVWISSLEGEEGLDVAPFYAGLEALFADTGLEDELDRITFPLLAYAGNNDQASTGAKRAACSIPNASFFSTGSGVHGEDLFNPSLILPVARAFLERVEAERS